MDKSAQKKCKEFTYYGKVNSAFDFNENLMKKYENEDITFRYFFSKKNSKYLYM
jgi:hypothetical protein